MATSAFKSSVSPAQRAAQAPAASAAVLAPVEVLGVLAYPSIVQPDPKSGDKYNTLVLITDPEDQQKLQELVAAACEQTFRSPQLPPGRTTHCVTPMKRTTRANSRSNILRSVCLVAW